MANPNEFDDLIRATRESQQAEARQRQQAEADARAEVLEARQRTLALARYAAGLLVSHAVSPTVQLQKAQPQTYSRGLFGRRANPPTYMTFTEGWMLARETHMQLVESGFIPDFDQGLALCRDGTLMQLIGNLPWSDDSSKPLGSVGATRYEPLQDDPRADAVVYWNTFPGTGRLFTWGDRERYLQAVWLC